MNSGGGLETLRRNIMSVNQTLDTIFSRTSYRGSFKEEPIPREDLTAIMEAGIAAPSGCNRQTTSLIAVDDPKLLRKIKDLYPNPSCQTAPAFILVLTQQIVGVDGHYYHVQDYAAAIENMLLAMKSLGYESCWYEGNVRPHAAQIADLLKIPDGISLVCLLPVGIAADEVVRTKGKKLFQERAWFNGMVSEGQ